MVEIQPESTCLPNSMVFHKKLAKHTKPKIHNNSRAQISKNAWTVHHPQAKTLETKEIAGPKNDIQFGKSKNTA